MAPAADDQPERSPLDRNLAQIIDLSRPHGSLATSTRIRTVGHRQESHEASSSYDSTHSVAPLDPVPTSHLTSRVAAGSADEMDPSVGLHRSLAHMLLVSDPQPRLDLFLV